MTCLEGLAAPDLSGILTTTSLPKTLAQVDTLVFATAVHYGLTVVTEDQRLAQAVSRVGLPVGNVVLILKTLVIRRVLSEAKCNALLAALVQRREYLLPPNLGHTATLHVSLTGQGVGVATGSANSGPLPRHLSTMYNAPDGQHGGNVPQPQRHRQHKQTLANSVLPPSASGMM